MRRRHDHAADVLGPERIDGEQGDERRVDPAREGHADVAEAVLEDVVAQAEGERRVDLGEVGQRLGQLSRGGGGDLADEQLLLELGGAGDHLAIRRRRRSCGRRRRARPGRRPGCRGRRRCRRHGRARRASLHARVPCRGGRASPRGWRSGRRPPPPRTRPAAPAPRRPRRWSGRPSGQRPRPWPAPRPGRSSAARRRPSSWAVGSCGRPPARRRRRAPQASCGRGGSRHRRRPARRSRPGRRCPAPRGPARRSPVGWPRRSAASGRDPRLGSRAGRARGRSTSSASSAWAWPIHSAIFAALPSMSPTVGSIWASAMRIEAKYRRPGLRSLFVALSRTKREGTCLDAPGRAVDCRECAWAGDWWGLRLPRWLCFPSCLPQRSPTINGSSGRPLHGPPTIPTPTATPTRCPRRRSHRPVCANSACTGWRRGSTRQACSTPTAMACRTTWRKSRLSPNASMRSRTKSSAGAIPSPTGARAAGAARPMSTSTRSAGRSSATRRPTVARRRPTACRAVCTATSCSTTTTTRASSPAPSRRRTSRSPSLTSTTTSSSSAMTPTRTPGSPSRARSGWRTRSMTASMTTCAMCGVG